MKFKFIFSLMIFTFLLSFTKLSALDLQNTPIDLVYKYIDLRDPQLNREGLPKLARDYDNQELKYSLRSVLKNLPWVRKIFIVMPNEKVKFLKEYKEISDKIVYVKDKDILGFDSESSICFEFSFWKLKEFGCSENFIYLNDDYFIGKPLQKSDFFYEDGGKVYPYVIYGPPVNYNQYKKIESAYNELKSIKPRNYFQYNRISTLKFCYQILDHDLQMPSRNWRHFPHNALGYNLNDLKEIYDVVKNNYEFADDCLNCKVRTRNALQHQTLYGFYTLNKYNRKINNKISYNCTDIPRAWNANYNYDLFCINHGGNKKVLNFVKAKIKMESLFPSRTKYEIPELNDGTYEIVSKLDEKKCLDIENAEKSDGANLQLYTKNGTKAQRFEVKYDSKGFYTIKAKCSDKYISLEDKSNTNNILQYNANNEENQKWYIIPDDNGYFYIISKQSLLAMDVEKGKTENGTNIRCWKINASNAQKFKFVFKGNK